MIAFKDGLTIGGDSPIRVNCNIGCNKIEDIQSEISKIEFIQSCNELPDMMMDLSLIELEEPLYNYIKNNLGLPFGVVLSYHRFTKSKGYQWEDIRDAFLQLCYDGVSFVTIHFTADLDLFSRANQIRKIPVTSRGGGMVLYDSRINNRTQNIFRENIDEIANIALKHNVVISLGTTFRPGTILDACDSVHIEETLRQLSICRLLQSKGVKVMVENIGHITLDKIATHSKLLSKFNAPIMPLGPLPTDAAINEDHIANAIGATFAAYIGCTHIINCVTRYEHSKSAITQDAIIEAIRAAKVAAHIADLSRNINKAYLYDAFITNNRIKEHSCLTDSNNCTRCSTVCPLKLTSI
ncbi:MAG: phosphomethylpyrimidine synthase ThiC [Alistipes sp.]|mgnify:CR=1 FL=1|nr:phosphomethylpyrimidine synthase ThiC [Paludibacteraceae bacterium]MBO5832628.1 phosphomethylpyrimidine synthase ThiC [Alistipes sp.]